MEKLLQSIVISGILISNALISSNEKRIRRNIFIFLQNFTFDVPKVTQEHQQQSRH